MVTMAFASPILPGRLEAWYRFNQETLGTWRAEHDALNRRCGVARELAWRQETPQGDLAIIYLELEDPSRLFGELARSGEPYAIWFREQTLAIHGLDLSDPQAGAPSSLEFDWAAA
jgi:hypothetical protein